MMTAITMRKLMDKYKWSDSKIKSMLNAAGVDSIGIDGVSKLYDEEEALHALRDLKPRAYFKRNRTPGKRKKSVNKVAVKTNTPTVKKKHMPGDTPTSVRIILPYWIVNDLTNEAIHQERTLDGQITFMLKSILIRTKGGEE